MAQTPVQRHSAKEADSGTWGHPGPPPGREKRRPYSPYIVQAAQAEGQGSGRRQGGRWLPDAPGQRRVLSRRRCCPRPRRMARIRRDMPGRGAGEASRGRNARRSQDHAVGARRVNAQGTSPRHRLTAPTAGMSEKATPIYKGHTHPSRPIHTRHYSQQGGLDLIGTNW